MAKYLSIRFRVSCFDFQICSKCPSEDFSALLKQVQANKSVAKVSLSKQNQSPSVEKQQFFWCCCILIT